MFDQRLLVDAGALAPQVTWGTSPDQLLAIDQRAPDPAALQGADSDAAARKMARAPDYRGLRPGTALQNVAIDQVFIGSCTNGRIDDLRAAAALLRGRRKAAGVTAIVVPGSARVARRAEAEGLAQVFTDAGFEWRAAGCSLCVAMNDDRLLPGQRCASTSNRNFEGHQGAGAHTHLVSPATAAASALAGRLAVSPFERRPPVHSLARAGQREGVPGQQGLPATTGLGECGDSHPKPRRY